MEQYNAALALLGQVSVPGGSAAIIGETGKLWGIMSGEPPGHYLSAVFSPKENANINWFENQLSFISRAAHVFNHRGLCYLLHMDFEQAAYLASSPEHLRQLALAPFVTLMVNESFPNLADAQHNPLLSALMADVNLGLSDAGAGIIPFSVVCSGMFAVTVLAPAFFHQYVMSPMLPVVAEKITDCGSTLVLNGVDTPQLWQLGQTVPEAKMMGKCFDCSTPAGKSH
ncbi:hypothetical protein DT73_06790 [Mangrovibacter sp. MFB070]|uniref:hypothetical protein n=1 Tax=Mangrovibacter sp. MFB070 TaxID=1224318 RepID=UPI0004D57C32|nr:hypothetical protein [Mangrovibacter sp. MFB070]KEA53511.1 hypothetical protein DT73_06790 [Mangrovibacter sp. MFB070]